MLICESKKYFTKKELEIFLQNNLPYCSKKDFRTYNILMQYISNSQKNFYSCKISENIFLVLQQNLIKAFEKQYIKCFVS